MEFKKCLATVKRYASKETFYLACMIQLLSQYLANYILEFRHARYVILFIFILLQYSSAFFLNDKSTKLKTERKIYFAAYSDKQHKRKVLLNSFRNGHTIDRHPQT